MLNKTIVFTAKEKVELIEKEQDLSATGRNVRIRTLYTAISAGTERANLMHETVIGGEYSYPRYCGYSDVAVVEEVGEEVKSVKVGDRVLCLWSVHQKYMLVDESRLVKINYDNIPAEQIALFFIAGFPLEGVRKTRLEIGESAMVMGLGILGQMAVQMLKAAGAVPVIAVDFSKKRRDLALSMGADYAIDPAGANLAAEVKKLTLGKGVDVCVDVAGNVAATNSALDCMARFGRVSLLGCTRTPGEYDLYQKVHATGLSLIGAHTMARPKLESRPGNWTERDDYNAIQALVAAKRLNFEPLISEIHSPEEAPEVFMRLVNDYGNFPIGVLFDWQKV